MTKEDKRESKLKTYFKKHKKKYLTGASVIVVGGVCYYVGVRHGKFSNNANIDVSTNTLNTRNSVLVNSNNNNTITNNVINNISQELSRPGHSGNAVYCPELNRGFPSQGRAERELQLPRGTVSKVLNGAKDYAKGGLTFIKIGDWNSDELNISDKNGEN